MQVGLGLCNTPCKLSFHCVSLLLYRNSQRPGAVSNITCQKASQGQYHDVKEDRFLIVKVQDHKTSLVYGATKLVMDREVTRWFVAFRDIL